MIGAIIGLLAETSLHPGAGQSAGTVDLPVAREAATGYPVIVGSSLKGALRDRAEHGGTDLNVAEVFGSPDGAGMVSVTDARLLLLPVRSLTGHYKWVTCPYLLERYVRDRQLAGYPIKVTIPYPTDKEAVVSKGNGRLFLEEISFDTVDGGLDDLISALGPGLFHASVRKRLDSGLVVISDNVFAHFARYGLPVNARNKLHEEKKTSENLWYEETLPPDSFLYALLFARAGQAEALSQIRALFGRYPYLQVGGNETVGQGWCAVAWCGKVGEDK